MATTRTNRNAEIAAAFGVPFDLDDMSAAWTPAQKLILTRVEAIASIERQIEERRYWIQSNLDRTMAQVEVPDGRPNSLSSVSADELNSLVGQLVALREALKMDLHYLFPKAS